MLIVVSAFAAPKQRPVARKPPAKISLMCVLKSATGLLMGVSEGLIASRVPSSFICIAAANLLHI